MTMNPDIKARWTAALRSGEYPQTRGALQRKVAEFDTHCGCKDCSDGYPVGFCCLGVLCELAVADGILTVGETGADGVAPYVSTSGTKERGILPSAVRDWAGLSQGNPIINDGHGLAHYNDRRKYTFAQIADLIEENL